MSQLVGRRAGVALLLALLLLGHPVSAQTPSATGVAPEAMAAGNVVDGSDLAALATPAGAATGGLPRDLSPLGMVRAADAVVQVVMLGLVLASVVTWTVALVKSVELVGHRGQVRRGLAILAGAGNLAAADAALAGGAGPVPVLVRATCDEARLSAESLDTAGGDGLKERVASQLSRLEAQAVRRIGRGTGLLATIGATAPFVGLFGTVWGITNAFIGIAQSRTTTLAVVAPGIAEALLATAFGLIAAIPAVVIYNLLARATAGYRHELADAAAAVERLVSRDLDRRHLAPAELAAAE